ncbi:MAG: hypothetical protein LBT54_05075, partial [Bifidobacteriaceae bacterium]|nr:hypothetical protein [Bifidobacteriaceae bacterium]
AAARAADDANWAAATGLPAADRPRAAELATALATLRARGFASQNADRSYMLGPAPLAPHVAVPATLAATMRPALLDLTDAVDETIHSEMPVGAEVRLIDGRERRAAPPASLRVGCHAPAHATAGGLAILAAMPLERVRSLHAHGLPPWPRRTVWTQPQLEAELERIRGRGHAVCFQNFEPGVVAVGAAVLDSDGSPVGAFGVALPLDRYSPRRVDEVVPPLLEACRQAGAAFTEASRGGQAETA